MFYEQRLGRRVLHNESASCRTEREKELTGNSGIKEERKRERRKRRRIDICSAVNDKGSSHTVPKQSGEKTHIHIRLYHY